MKENPLAFILENTILKQPSLVPELELYLADEAIPLWQMTADELDQAEIPIPFWAFAWAGGQAVSRYIFDTPDLVQGKRILDIGSGSGLVALSALKAGATSVVANDIDPLAILAIGANAKANALPDRLSFESQDILDAPAPLSSSSAGYDMIFAGDICYEEPMSSRMVDCLKRYAEAGSTVILGDPGRTYLPRELLKELAVYNVPTPLELEDSDLRRTTVWALPPTPPPPSP